MAPKLDDPKKDAPLLWKGLDQMPTRSLTRLRKYVKSGGKLVTSGHIIQDGMP